MALSRDKFDEPLLTLYPTKYGFIVPRRILLRYCQQTMSWDGPWEGKNILKSLITMSMNFSNSIDKLVDIVRCYIILSSGEQIRKGPSIKCCHKH